MDSGSLMPASPDAKPNATCGIGIDGPPSDGARSSAICCGDADVNGVPSHQSGTEQTPMSRQGSAGDSGSGRRRFVVTRLSNPIGDNYCYLNSVVHLLSRCDAVRRVVNILCAQEPSPRSSSTAGVAATAPSFGRLIDEDEDLSPVARRASANDVAPRTARITLCPVRVVAATLAEYDSTPVDGVASLRQLRAFIGQVASTFRAGIMNDASEVMEGLLAVLDMDAMCHTMDDGGADTNEETGMTGATRCIRTHDDTAKGGRGMPERTALAADVVHSALELTHRPIAALVAFSCTRRWRCETATCALHPAAHGGHNFMRVTHYVRRVYVYPMLYDDAVGPAAPVPPTEGDGVMPPPSPRQSIGGDGGNAPRTTHKDGAAATPPFRQSRDTDDFSFLVRSTEPKEGPFVCPGCGERAPERAMEVQWTLPSHHVLLHLVWHEQKPKPQELLHFYTHILSDVVCTGDLILGDIGAAVPVYRCASIHAVVLYKGNHYVSVIKHPTTHEWWLANDTKPVVRVGLSWGEMLRFLYRGQYVPLLLCGSMLPCTDAAVNGVASKRPTEDYMREAPPPKAPPVAVAMKRPSQPTLQLGKKEITPDTTQRTLDEWANSVASKQQPQQKDDNNNDNAPRTLLRPGGSRKRARSDEAMPHDVVDLTTPDAQHPQPPSAPTNGSAGSSSPGHAVDDPSRRETTEFLLGHFRGTVDAAVIERVAHDKTKTPDAMFEALEAMARRSRRIGLATIVGAASDALTSVSTKSFSVLQAARSTVESRHMALPRPFATAPNALPPLGHPLKGRTFVLLVPPTERKRHEDVVTGCGGVVQPLKDKRARVLDSHLLVDKRYLQHLADGGDLHKKALFVGLLDTYKNALLTCEEFLNEVMRKKHPVTTIVSEGRYAIDYRDIATMVERSTAREMAHQDGNEGHHSKDGNEGHHSKPTQRKGRVSTRSAPTADGGVGSPTTRHGGGATQQKQEASQPGSAEARAARLVPESLAAAPLFNRSQRRQELSLQTSGPSPTSRAGASPNSSTAVHTLTDEDDVEFVVVQP